MANLVTQEWSVSQAGLTDINAIARMMAERIDNSATLGHDHDAEATMRLVLSHGPLSSGEIWIARDSEGIAAVSVWSPSEDASWETAVRTAISRELPEVASSIETLHENVAEHIEAEALPPRPESISDLTLILIGVAPRYAGDQATAIAEAVIGPVRDRRRSANLPSYALAVNEADIKLLNECGFLQFVEIDLTPSRLWVGLAQ